VPRPLELRPYRYAVYAAYGVVCALLIFALFRSVIGDLYGRNRGNLGHATPLSCLEDLDRLYAQVSARAVQPAPRGLDTGLLAREWDRWSIGWQNELAKVSARCGLDDAREPALADLAVAREGLEDLRRELSRSGESVSEGARRVKDALAAAREKLIR
jgi:hypothetical protein